MYKKVLLFSGLVVSSAPGFSQAVAVKTNLFYGVYSSTPNLSTEWEMGKRNTLELGGGYNPWNLNGKAGNNKKLVHWLGQVEYRYWLCRSFSGHFFGMHALGSQYNISGHELPLLFGKGSRNYRYEGQGYGGGISYGYNFFLGKRWSLETTIGAGYVRLHYDKYDCRKCGSKIGTENRNYLGPTKAGVSLIYFINNRARRPKTTVEEQKNDPVQQRELISPVHTPHPYVAQIAPEGEEIKRRDISAEVYLDFVVNQWQIRTDYMNNSAELKKITDLVQEIRTDPGIHIKNISIEGYASPEGTIANNRKLSENRARSLIGYLASIFDYPANIYNVKFGGENWEGLKQRVEASDMPGREQVLAIIESMPEEINYVTNTSRKKSLMDLDGGRPYRYMLREFFPSLRKVVCKIDFEITAEREDTPQIEERKPTKNNIEKQTKVSN